MAETQKKKYRFSTAWIWLTMVLAIFLVVAVARLMQPESQEAINLKADLQSTIVEQTGKKSNMSKDRVDDISVSRVPAGWNVELFLNADKGFTLISTQQIMWQQAIAILASLSENNQLNDISISWIYPVEGQNHEVRDESVMSFRLDKSTRNQLIWENVEPSLLPDIAFDYEEHPILNE